MLQAMCWKKMNSKFAHFFSCLEKYEKKFRFDCETKLSSDAFNDENVILDVTKYIVTSLYQRHPPSHLYSMYKIFEDVKDPVCDAIHISCTSVGIASKISGECRDRLHRWEVLPGVINPTKLKKSCKGSVEDYKLDFALVEAIQSMRDTVAEAIIAHLCLGHSSSFAQYFHKLENILGNTEESMKNMFFKKALA